jgi:hypothetical protein
VSRPPVITVTYRKHGGWSGAEHEYGPPVRGNAAQQEVPKMSHLDNITARQRKSRVRDALFTAFIALAAIVSISTLAQAVLASSVVHR